MRGDRIGGTMANPNFTDWTLVKSDREQMRLAKTRRYGTIVGLHEGRHVYFMKNIGLLSEAELEVCRLTALAAARRHAQMAVKVAGMAKERFGEDVELSEDILDLAADQSSDEPQ